MDGNPDTVKTRYSFKHLDLRGAEEAVVAACIDYRHAMRYALQTLAVDDFRSEVASDLRLIFYTLAGWYKKRTYDELENRYRLEGLAELHDGNNRDLPAWRGYLEMLTCPAAIIEDYAKGICQALKMRNAMYDARLKASQDYWNDNPLHDAASPAPPPQPVKRGNPAPPPRARGGVA